MADEISVDAGLRHAEASVLRDAVPATFPHLPRSRNGFGQLGELHVDQVVPRVVVRPSERPGNSVLQLRGVARGNSFGHVASGGSERFAALLSVPEGNQEVASVQFE